ncbi:MAG: amidohydrolase [Clostridia bacterium]|nr:amidohydrolase [Clostridia bacterium]MBQ2326219.1 amidohydrolase [Clostridia bacterium]
MILIKNGHVKTMAGPDLIGGDVLIENGKIKAVGMNLEAEGAQVIDANGRLVVPGFVDAHCHIGLDNEGMGWEGMDYNEIVEPCTPHLRAIDSINPIDESFLNAVKGGVTTAVTGPGSANVIGGTFVAIKLHGKRVDNMILKDNIAMKVAFGENPKRCYSNMKKSPSTRMATAALLREMLFKTKRYMEDKEAGKNPAFDMKLEAMIPVLKKEMPIKAHAHRADDIFTSIRIAREFDIDITLDHCTDGALIADELAKEGLPAFVGPTLGKKSKIELRNKSFETPGILNKAGVNISIITDAPVIPLQNLPLCAGLAVNAGLDMEEAWKAITINPANATGIGDRVGSLEVGKDADVVIHSGNPLTEISSQVDVAIINGEIVYER